MIDRNRVAELRDEVGQDDLAEVVALFCEEVEETLTRLRQGAAHTLADDLHFLKGSALNIGMSDVGDICVTFESALRSDPAARPDVENIAQAFFKARVSLQDEIEILCARSS